MLFGRKDRQDGEGSGTDRYLVCRTEITKCLSGYEARAIAQSSHEVRALPQRQAD